MADGYALTLPQRDLWLALQLDGGGHTVQILDEITGPFDAGAWKRAFDQVIARHEALRTTFANGADGDVVQSVQATAAAVVEHHDARDWSPDRIRTMLRDRLNAPFDLAAAPLVRVCALQTAGDRTYVLHVASHLVIDGAAMGVVHAEIAQAYTRGAIASPAPTVRYRDYVALGKQMIAGKPGEKSWTYWKGELEGTSLHLDLPLDRPRPARRTGRVGTMRIDVSNDALAELARTLRSTPPRVLLAAFAATLQRYSGASDFVIGCPVAGRPKLFEQAVGTFDNVALVRIQITATTTFLDLVTSCTRRVASALEHQLLPLAAVAERFELQRGRGVAPFDVMFNVNRAIDKRGTAEPRTTAAGIVHTGRTSPLGDAQIERCALGDVRTSCDLAFQGIAFADGLKLELEYDTDVFEQATIEQFAAHFTALLEAAMAAPDQPVTQLGPVRARTELPKLGGFAIDCAAIERIIVEHPGVEHPGVEQAAVVVRDGMLVGYLAPEVDATAVRAHLASRVAGYLVPAAFVVLPQIDRSALPPPGEAAFIGHELPVSPEEQRVADIYRALLGVACVGRCDDFFALGGNSLLTIRLVAEIERAFEVRVPVSRVFEHPTVEALATFVKRAVPGEQPLRVTYARTNAITARATVPQEYFYYLDVDDRDPASYCATFVAMIEGPLDAALLAKSYREVVAYHGVYRTALREVDGVLQQTVLDGTAPELEVVDRSSTPLDQRQAELARASAELVARGYDLAAARGLLHSRLIRFAVDHHVLVDVVHHVAMDGASVATLRTQLLEGYVRLQGGAASALPAEPPLQYIDFAETRARWIETPSGKSHQDFWASRMTGAPPLVLDGDFPRAPIDARRDAAPLGITADASYTPEYLRVPEPVYAAVTTAARAARTTPFVVFLGGLAWLLHERSSQTDLTIQSSYSPRAHDPALVTINGCLTSWTVFRVDLATARSLHDAIDRAKAVVELVHDHGAPHDFYRLVPHHLRRVVFNYVPTPRAASATFGDLVLEPHPWPFPPWKRPWDLHLSLVDDSTGAWLVWTGFERLFTKETVVALRERYIEILRGV